MNNLIVGKLWIDHYGDMVVKNWQTGHECVITFKPKDKGGWFGNSVDLNTVGGEITGFVRDANGEVYWSLSGRWDEQLLATRERVGSGPDFLNRPVMIWKRDTLPQHSAQYFNYTRLAMMLNELPDQLKQILPPSDSRLRSDQRAMEEGQWDAANAGKERLEKAQRERRTKIVSDFKETGIPNGPHRDDMGIKIGEEWWTPRWFVREIDRDSSEEHWRFTNEYWAHREKVVNGETETWPEWVPPLFN